MQTLKLRQWVNTPKGYGRVSKLEPQRACALVRLASSGRRFRFLVSQLEIVK